MEQLQIRENEIFETLKKISKTNFVVIGGYAVNAYTLPRFSVDCDIVIKDREELQKISELLSELNYKKVKNASETPYDGIFERYEKEIDINFKVSMDILIKEVVDRDTEAKFSADWVFENSDIRKLRGKTINQELKVRTINPNALFVMKMISCRLNDIRDIFLLVSSVDNSSWIKKEVSERHNFNDLLIRVIEKINSKQFKDGLQGVFGIIEDKIYEKHKNLILNLNL